MNASALDSGVRRNDEPRLRNDEPKLVRAFGDGRPGEARLLKVL
jgi:hypothetical protein